MNRMKKMLKAHEKAYFTVEAALILPMVMLFTAVMIFMAFYSHDRCIMEQSAYEAALYGAQNCIKDAREAQREAQLAAGKLTADRLFALKDFTYEVSVTADAVAVAYHGKINMPFIVWLGDFVDDLDFSIDASKEAKRIRQVQEIRFFRTINGKGLAKHEERTAK